ncbi:MAG: zonular occludens toxin domain-containing protein [Lachnospiraceae bacterium]|nr:zonular occludens toxin domain-containing protein [Muribaculaceae bacterium]MCM1409690.1 zonular occludens toxin domain-containing protein [Lachnospiraceae bacterium]
MLWYHWMVLIVFLVAVFFLLYTRKYRNPYKLIMVFGKKGSGKSTFMTKTAIQQMRKGRVVYSTVFIPGVRLFDVDDIGRCNFPEGSVVLIDEVGMVWDNRNYKNFRTDVRDWFKLQRHNKVTVYLFSQTFDVDVKLRNLTDSMYLITNHFSVLSIARKIKRGIVIVNPDGQSEARIADSLEFVSPLLSLFGARSLIFTWIPNWARYFNSFELPDKPPIGYDQLYPYPQAKAADHARMVRWRIRQRILYLRLRRPAGSGQEGMDDDAF